MKNSLKYYINTEEYFKAITAAADGKGLYSMGDICEFAGLGRNALTQMNRDGAISLRKGVAFREAYNVDYRNFLIKPPVNKEPKKAPQEATKPAQTNGNDVVNLLAECLIEILAELKDRHKNIHYFTPEESLFISLCLQNKEKVKKVFTDETN